MYKQLLRAPDDPWPSAGATLAMHHDQALSISSAAWRPRLASQEGVVVKGYFSRSNVMQYAPKNRVAALLPRTVRPAPGASKRGRAPPPPPAWPARNLLFDTQRRRRKKMRLSDAFVKRVFQEQAPPLRCAAGCPIARFGTQAYALIVLLSTHGRELLAQTAKLPRGTEAKKKLTLRHPARGGSRARDSEKVATQVTQEVESARAKPCPETRAAEPAPENHDDGRTANDAQPHAAHGNADVRDGDDAAR